MASETWMVGRGKFRLSKRDEAVLLAETAFGTVDQEIEQLQRSAAVDDGVFWTQFSLACALRITRNKLHLVKALECWERVAAIDHAAPAGLEWGHALAEYAQLILDANSPQELPLS